MRPHTDVEARLRLAADSRIDTTGSERNGLRATPCDTDGGIADAGHWWYSYAAMRQSLVEGVGELVCEQQPVTEQDGPGADGGCHGVICVNKGGGVIDGEQAQELMLVEVKLLVEPLTNIMAWPAGISGMEIA